MGQPQPLFHLFSSFRTEKFSCQQDSNSDRQSRMRELRPPDHQKFIFQPGIPYNLTTTDDSRLMGEHNQVSYLDVLFGDKSGGFFVEAGAFDGELFSNTLLLEKNRGWTGLLVSLQHRDRRIPIDRACHSMHAIMTRCRLQPHIRFHIS